MEEFYSEAKQTWDLEKLHQDIANAKKRKLNNNEKIWLRGLLCGFSPKIIAEKIFWTSASLRTELSRGLYIYIAILTKQEKVVWHKIANDLEKMGYKNPEGLPEIVKGISSHQNKILPASEIIAVVIQLSIKNSVSMTEEAKQAFEQGDNLNELKDYSEALKYYYCGLKVSNKLDIDILINIARCYDRLGMYDQSLSICNCTLDFLHGSTEEAFNRSRLYIFIGGVFDELATKLRNRSNFNAALKYYELADCKFTTANSPSLSDHVETSYLLPIWNQIALILYFVKEEIFDSIIEEKQYEELAKKKMERLLEVAQTGLEGGGYKRYRIQILDDMRSVFDGLGVYWQKQLNEFKNIKKEVQL